MNECVCVLRVVVKRVSAVVDETITVQMCYASFAQVKKVGDETFRVCQMVVNEMITVSTDEICDAIKDAPPRPSLAADKGHPVGSGCVLAVGLKMFLRPARKQQLEVWSIHDPATSYQLYHSDLGRRIVHIFMEHEPVGSARAPPVQEDVNCMKRHDIVHDMAFDVMT